MHPTALVAMHWWAITHHRKKSPVKTASSLGKGAAARQQDEACAADWKIIFSQVQAVWEPKTGN